MRSIEIGKNEAEQRVDRFLMKYLNNTTRSNIYKMLRKKIIKVNDKKVKEDYFLQLGDVISIYVSEESLKPLIKEYKKAELDDFDIEIIFEDEDLLVVNKPKGLLTHPDKSEYKNTLSTKVVSYLHDYVSRTFKPAPIHRLDKNTSGLVMFGKNYTALKEYNEIMREGEVKKYYQCIVHGKVRKSRTIEGYLVKDEFANKVKLVSHDSDKAKYVKTIIRPIKQFDNFTLLEVQLITGRSHQIRVSLSNIGHPIVGDLKYGGRKIKGQTTQMLHCYKICIKDYEFVAKSKDIDKFVKSY